MEVKKVMRNLSSTERRSSNRLMKTAHQRKKRFLWTHKTDDSGDYKTVEMLVTIVMTMTGTFYS